MNKDRNWKMRTAVVMLLAAIAVPGSRGAISAGNRDTVEKRLQRLEDIQEIRQLIIDYGRYLDQRDFSSFSALFAEKDGEWIGGMGKAKSAQGIRKLMEDTIGRDTDDTISGPNRHLFTNESIEVNGDQAKATTKWIFLVQNSSKQPQLFYLGHYQDTLIREGGRWKFLKRIVYGDIPVDDPLARR